MKSFRKQKRRDRSNNPFPNFTEEEFNHMIEEGFEPTVLDCYAALEGNTAYSKSFESSIGWWVTCYITEKGMAVDHDHDCGGNFCNQTWWFEDGEYTVNEFNYKTFKHEDVTYRKFGPNTFEEAWDKMIEYSQSL